MGLMLSLLVTCVGVLEAIACWKHFENGYLPLSCLSDRSGRRNASIASSWADDVSRHLGRYLEDTTDIHRYGYTPSLAEHRRNEPNSSSEENSEWDAGISGCRDIETLSGCDDPLNCVNIDGDGRAEGCVQSGICESSKCKPVNKYQPTPDRQDEHNSTQILGSSPEDVAKNIRESAYHTTECSLNREDDVREELCKNICNRSSATWAEADSLLKSRSQFAPSPSKHKNVDINWPVFRPPSPVIKKTSVPEALAVNEGEDSGRDRSHSFEVGKRSKRETYINDVSSANDIPTDVNKDKLNSSVSSERSDVGASSRNNSVDYDEGENCVRDQKVEVTSSEDEAEEKSRIGDAREPSFATSSREPKSRHKPARIRSFEDADPRHSRRSSRARNEEGKKDESAKNDKAGVKNDTTDKFSKSETSHTDEKKNESCDDCGDNSTISEDVSNSNRSEAEEAFWLIFSGEYTKAMSKDWHSGHFSCWQCDESLTGQRYVLRDDHPYCIKCYESVFANTCEECNKTIGIDSKDLSYKDKHWHEACFLCHKCRVSLVDKQFGSKADKIYCGNCYDAQFASRCDGCGEIFRAGTKKMEYKTRQWHEKCFCCVVCKTAIGTKSFIPREQEIYCATCYEEKFATRCVKCNKIITSGGVTYKNEPWHRECFTCTNCNTSLAGQRFTSRDEKPYCAECFGELFAKRCTSCSRPITGIGGTRFISFEDRHWHNDCFICALCKTSLVGRGFITDGDDIICPECAKQKLM